MRSQTSNTHAQPQADGDSRPFSTHGIDGPVRVHAEKSGPAFTRRTPAPPLQESTVLGVAAIIGKVRQLVRMEPLISFASMASEERDELRKAAVAVVRSQDPVRVRVALEVAKRAGEGVLVESGITEELGLQLARRIAAHAVLTYRLSLEGALDQKSGGVQ